MSGALKTGSVFDCGKIPASRSYAAGGARYLRTDLMLLTHAKYAFKDPRGRFGICVGVSRVFALAGAAVSYCCVAQ